MKHGKVAWLGVIGLVLVAATLMIYRGFTIDIKNAALIVLLTALAILAAVVVLVKGARIAVKEESEFVFICIVSVVGWIIIATLYGPEDGRHFKEW